MGLMMSNPLEDIRDAGQMVADAAGEVYEECRCKSKLMLRLKDELHTSLMGWDELADPAPPTGKDVTNE